MTRSLPKRIAMLLPSVGAVLLPKCPFCIVALASALNAVGVDMNVYSRAFIPTLSILLILPALLVAWSRRGVHRYFTLGMMGAGAALYLFSRTHDWTALGQAPGLTMYALGLLAWPGSRTCECEISVSKA